MKRSPLLLPGLLLVLGAGAWVATSYYRQQNRLYEQLQQLTDALATENDEAAHEAENTFRGMQASVEKNHNQPADLAVLRRTENVRHQVENLIFMVRGLAEKLRQATDTPPTSAQLHHPTAPAGQLLSPARQQALHQQVAALADTLRRFEPAGTAPLTAPAFGPDLLVVEALADLSQLESDVLAHQARALQRLSRLVASPSFVANKLLAAATAESNVVAPGDTYRAELLLVNHFGADLRMAMTCNGRPVPVDSNGVGMVRFRAPSKPGRASWTGTVRTNQNGRDTTFVVRVPYRVARR